MNVEEFLNEPSTENQNVDEFLAGIDPKPDIIQTDIGEPIDVNRPIIKNKDQTYSTEQTITVDINKDGKTKWINLPTIIDGKKVPDAEAIDLYFQGKNKSVGDFETMDQAVSSAKKRTEKINEVRNIDQLKTVDEFLADIPNQSVDEFLAQTDYTPATYEPDDILTGAREAVVGIATGLVGTSIGGLAGLGAIATNYAGLTDVDPSEVISDVSNALTVSPDSKIGQGILSAIAAPFEWWRKGVSEKVGGEVYKTGATPSPVAATMAYTASELVPYILGPKIVKTAIKTTAKGAEFARYGLKGKPPILESHIAKYYEARAQSTVPESHVYKYYEAQANNPKILMEERITNPLKSITEPVREAFAPISTGSKEAMVAAKTYANNLRMSDTLRNELLNKLDKKFKKEDFTKMGDAVIAEELALLKKTPSTAGLDTLSFDQQQAVTLLMERHKPVADAAVEMGILKKSNDMYFPRKTIEVLDSKAIDRIEKTAGIRLRTTTPHAKKRKYETVEETAAAASEALGKEMKVVNDIRVLPLVTAELEKAIAGKQLVNNIKYHSRQMGADVLIGETKPGFFTIDHPAMTEWKPKLIKIEDKYKLAKDEFGEPIFEKKPIYIHESFKGPLEAVLKNESGNIANAFMQLKAKSMSMIMWNPLMHGMVIWGKALPYQFWRTLTFRNYADGRKIYNGPESELWIKHATSHGMAPIGNQGWMQRMNDIMQTPQLTAGRSTTAKVAGKLAKPFGKQEATMTAIDKAGKFWHDTLLWEPIRHAQMGMYKNLYENFVNKGRNPEASAYLAAHMANRFAGSVPFEDMGHGIRAASNFMLFSRTFNATNMGIYKDALKGLPSPVQAQILESASKVDLAVTNNALRKAATATLAKDILAMYALNSMAQNVIQYWKTGDAGAIAKEYADNLEVYKETIDKNPMNALLHFEDITAQSLNEPGKETRIYMGEDPYGAGTYLRLPMGKIGEDLQKFVTSPIALATDKLSPTMHWIAGVATNDKSINKGYGLEIYNKKGSLKDAPENLGKILAYFMETHTPYGFIADAIDIAKNEDPTGVQTAKVIGQLAGFSVSKGSPAGPTSGFIYDTLEQHRANVRNAMPDIIKQLRLGNNEKAQDLMVNKAGMTPDEIRLAVTKMYPQMSEKSIEKFLMVSDEYERKKIQRMINKYYKSSQ